MEFFNVNGEVILGLAKNPVGLSEVLRTITYYEAEKSIMFILNDYAPDGKDISWIWDANFEEVLKVSKLKNFYCVGTRAEEIALRLKYTGFPEDKLKIYHSIDRTDIENPINEILKENNRVYIIGTFTAMPESRKILVKRDKK